VSTEKHLHVVQTKSVIGQAEAMRVTIRGLGLSGPGSRVTVANTPSFRGAIKKVMHLVTVEEVAAGTTNATKAAAKPEKKKAGHHG
jgi:large subunit ribosomal protein L30